MSNTHMNKIYWCNNCNVPLLSAKCNICNRKGVYCTADLRPVFEGERKLLSTALNITLPHNLFYNRRRLIVEGQVLLSSHFNEVNVLLHPISFYAVTRVQIVPLLRYYTGKSNVEREDFGSE